MLDFILDIPQNKSPCLTRSNAERDKNGIMGFGNYRKIFADSLYNVCRV